MYKKIGGNFPYDEKSDTVQQDLDIYGNFEKRTAQAVITKDLGDRMFNLSMAIGAGGTFFLILILFLSLAFKVSLKDLVKAAFSESVRSALFLSLYTSTISTAIACILGIAVAYILSFKKIPYKKALGTLTTMPMVLPPAVGGYLLLLTFGRYGLVGRWFYFFGYSIMFTDEAIILAQVFVILPFVINAVRASFEAISSEYLEAAMTMGAGEWQIFSRILIPMAKPGIITGTIMAFARAMGEFGATMMVSGLNETMPVAIYRNAVGGNRAEADILSMVLILVSFGVMMAIQFLQRQDSREVTP